MLRGLKKAPSSSVVTDLAKDQKKPESSTPEPPVQSPPTQEQAPEASSVPTPQPEVASSTNPEPAKPKREKLSFYHDADGAHRLRATHVSTQAITGYRSLSDFIAAAVEKECVRLEAAYNDGEVFRTGADAVKRGRPYDFR
ncbi:hypothetical protein LG284_16170 (plasmid) [Citricoccus nitrophenolicus]